MGDSVSSTRGYNPHIAPQGRVERRAWRSAGPHTILCAAGRDAINRELGDNPLGQRLRSTARRATAGPERGGNSHHHSGTLKKQKKTDKRLSLSPGGSPPKGCQGKVPIIKCSTKKHFDPMSWSSLRTVGSGKLGGGTLAPKSASLEERRRFRDVGLQIGNPQTQKKAKNRHLNLPQI